jgi:hypothetical protein
VIDEMQDLDADLLGALLTVQHAAGQRGWPFYIGGGCLPSVPGRLSESRSYAERLFHYRMVGKLNPDAAAEALTLPITRLGAALEGQALTTCWTQPAGTPISSRPTAAPVGDSLRQRDHRRRRTARRGTRNSRPGPRVLRRTLATGDTSRTKLSAGDEPGR